MNKTIAVLLLVIAAVSCSRPTSIKSSVFGGKKYDSSRAILITKDRFLFAGMTESSGIGSVDVYLMQTDKYGRLKSQNTYGGKSDDRGFAITGTREKGFMIAGYTTSYGSGSTDVYLIKTDGLGNYINSKAFGGVKFDEAKSICADGTGGYMVAGHTNSFGEGAYDAYIIRVDSEGNCVWAKTFGGFGNDRVNSITPAGNGKFMIVGYSDSKSKKLPDFYVLVIDLDGKLLTENYYGDMYSDTAISVIMSRDGNFVIVGDKGTPNSVTDIKMIKTDISGRIIWEKVYGGAGADYPSQVIETKDGGLVIAANTESQGKGMIDVLIIKTDDAGKVLWERVFGDRQDDYAGGIAEDSDGGLVMAGWTRSYGSGDYDVYLLKLDKNGL